MAEVAFGGGVLGILLLILVIVAVIWFVRHI
jgi:hypothetical protein